MASVLAPSLLQRARHLDWLPDESLYSLASRHHQLAGNVRPEQTAAQLFGHAHGGFPHDLPAGLDYFASAFDTRLGSGVDIALRRTVLPLILIFRADADRRDALSSMRSSHLGALKARLGLLAGGFGANCYLKACETCIELDTTRFGTPYWHLSHQLPGVWVCLLHDTWLRISTIDRAGKNRFGWALPQMSNLEVVAPTKSSTSDVRSLGYRFAKLAIDGAKTGRERSLDAVQTARALAAGMLSNGWTSTAGRLKRSVATAGLGSTYEALSFMPEWHAANRSESALYHQINSNLTDPTHAHVLRILTLVVSLFESWDEFSTTVSIALPEPQTGPGTQEATTLERARERFAELSQMGGAISATAKQCGVSVSTAQGWAAAAGDEPAKRPSKLRGDALEALLIALRNGEDVQHIASDLGISACSIYRVLRTTVGLRAQWLQARCARITEGARVSWIAALKSAPSMGVAVARLLEPRAYAWLYRCDREWLLQTNGRVQSPQPSTTPRVNWDQRDQDLALACAKAALAVREAAPRAAVKLVDILQRVPHLRPKLSQLQHLPLTTRVLRNVCSQRKQQQFAGTEAIV
jgi:transposase